MDILIAVGGMVFAFVLVILILNLGERLGVIVSDRERY